MQTLNLSLFCVLQVAIENIADIDKVSIIRSLKKEFWSFPRLVGWGTHTQGGDGDRDKGAAPTSPVQSGTSGGGDTGGGDDCLSARGSPAVQGVGSGIGHASNTPTLVPTTPTTPPPLEEAAAQFSYTSVPSDALHGNFLGAINVTLNLLEKHFMDR